MSVESLGEQLEQYNLPLLRRGISTVNTDFPEGVSNLANPPAWSFDATGSIQFSTSTENVSMFTCAPSAVVNSVRALGFDPSASSEILAKRLWAAQQSYSKRSQQDKNLPELIKKLQDGDDYWVTPEGIEFLFTLVKSPLGTLPLPLQVAQTEDVGVFHQALAHGYKGVYLDARLSHAITVGGVEQKGEQTSWQLIPPDAATLLTITRLDQTNRMVEAHISS